MLGREVVEREQHVENIGDLGGGFRPLRPVLGGERFCGCNWRCNRGAGGLVYRCSCGRSAGETACLEPLPQVSALTDLHVEVQRELRAGRLDRLAALVVLESSTSERWDCWLPKPALDSAAYRLRTGGTHEHPPTSRSPRRGRPAGSRGRSWPPRMKLRWLFGETPGQGVGSVD